MYIVLIIAVLCKLSCGEQTSLEFEEEGSRIFLPDGMMDKASTTYSICSWVKNKANLFTFPNLCVTDPATDDSCDHEFTYASFLFGTLNRWSMNITLGTWYHVCFIQNEDLVLRGYINGEEIGVRQNRRVTDNGTVIKRGLKTFMANGHGNIYHVFKGYLFKFNIYNRVLTELERKNMASNMSSCQEHMLSSIRVLDWEFLQVYDRSIGIWRVYDSTCPDKRPYLTDAQCWLELTNGVEESKKKQLEQEEDLNKLQKKFQETDLALEETRKGLGESRIKLQQLKKQGWSQYHMISFDA